MDPSVRIQIIRARLQERFAPDTFEIIDNSEEHRGHAGSRDGAGHYTIIIRAKELISKSRIEAHREIYALLNDLIPIEIHALRIKLNSDIIKS